MPLNYTPNAVIKARSNLYRMKKQTAYWQYFLDIRPEIQKKMKQPSAYPINGHADGCVLHQNFRSIFGGAVDFGVEKYGIA